MSECVRERGMMRGEFDQFQAAEHTERILFPLAGYYPPVSL